MEPPCLPDTQEKSPDVYKRQVLDHSKLGYNLTTIIGVQVKGGVLENWEDMTSYHKNVLCMYDVTGEFDAILIARFKDLSLIHILILSQFAEYWFSQKLGGF